MSLIIFNIPRFKTKRIEEGWTVYTLGDNSFEFVGSYTRFEVRYMKTGSIFISGMKYERKRGYSRPEKVISKSSETTETNLVAEMQKLINEVISCQSCLNS